MSGLPTSRQAYPKGHANRMKSFSLMAKNPFFPPGRGEQMESARQPIGFGTLPTYVSYGPPHTKSVGSDGRHGTHGRGGADGAGGGGGGGRAVEVALKDNDVFDTVVVVAPTAADVVVVVVKVLVAVTTLRTYRSHAAADESSSANEAQRSADGMGSTVVVKAEALIDDEVDTAGEAVEVATGDAASATMAEKLTVAIDVARSKEVGRVPKRLHTAKFAFSSLVKVRFVRNDRLYANEDVAFGGHPLKFPHGGARNSCASLPTH